MSNTYTVGSICELISSNNVKKKMSKSTEPKTREEDLESVFGSPMVTKMIESTKLSEKDSISSEHKDDDNVKESDFTERKLMREKSKLIKLRQKEKEENGNRTVFVGNVPIDCEKKDILKLFSKFGQIESIRLRNFMRKDLNKPIKASVIKKDFHPLCKSINAYIVYKDEASAHKALKRNGKEVNGCHLRVDIASSVSKKEYNRKSCIFVGNVPFDGQEEQLRKHFSACGEIVNVRIIRDKFTRLGKGFGYVEFKSSDGVSLALKLDGTKLGKNKLRIQRCVKNPQAKPTQEKRSLAKNKPNSRKLKNTGHKAVARPAKQNDKKTTPKKLKSQKKFKDHKSA